jgi:hypothetical protein
MLSRQLYLTTILGLVVGYAWIGFHVSKSKSENSRDFTTCLIKITTGYPCPACGSSRSILSLIEGDVRKAALINPFGLFMAFLMILLPFWMLFDMFFKRKTYWQVFNKMESLFANKLTLFLFAIIVLVNWIWNIYKAL